MAETSLRRRIFTGVTSIVVATALLMSLVVYYAYEDMERNLLQLVFSDEEAFFLAHLDIHGNHLETATLDAFFVPVGTSAPLPALFEGLAVPYIGELHKNSKSYLIHTEHLDGGTLYLAKDITLFERRERISHMILATTVLLVLVVGIVLAHLTTRRLVKPLARLARAVDRLVPGNPRGTDQHFPVDFEEAELRRIAQPFAYYLKELDQLMQRERRLLAMASHELRTPVSTIAGALDVIEKYGVWRRAGDTSVDTCVRALQRMRMATDEMREQIDAILTLSRGNARSSEERAAIDIEGLSRTLIAELAAVGLPASRIVLSIPDQPIQLYADPTLVKMLLRNLLQNTLQHTPSGPIRLHLTADEISVADQGSGLPAPYLALLGGSGEQSAPSEGGLGLYLVTLIAERLGWELHATTPAQGGTHITVSWQGQERLVQGCASSLSSAQP